MRTPSSTSSSEAPISWTRAIRDFARHGLVVGVLFLLIGELWFRMPWTTKILVYEFDEERNYRLVGRQSRGLGLGNFSVMSPPISINSAGFRNPEIDWTAPTILAVGSSQLLGPGIEDNEVWTAIVSERLSAAAGGPVVVVNAGTPGYGPYHQAVTARRYLERHPRPHLLVVRAAVSDRAFPKPTAEQLDALRRHMALSTRVRRVSEFLPFLVNKLAAQVGAIRDTFVPPRLKADDAPADEAAAAADAMWRSEAPFWHEIVDLAGSAGVPVLFFVDGADGAPSARRLTALLADAFRDRDDVTVGLLGAREAGLDVEDDEERRQRYREWFLLGYDPHANARLHRVTAEFLTPIVATLGTPHARGETQLRPARVPTSGHPSPGRPIERTSITATPVAHEP
jgi:hypothetical protein